MKEVYFCKPLPESEPADQVKLGLCVRSMLAIPSLIEPVSVGDVLTLVIITTVELPVLLAASVCDETKLKIVTI